MLMNESFRISWLLLNSPQVVTRSMHNKHLHLMSISEYEVKSP